MLPESVNRLWLKLKTLAAPRRLERDLEDELAFHLSMREERNRAEGVLEPDVAKRQFGNATRLKEACREMWTFAFWETLRQDLRYGARVLRRNPGFTVVAVLTLALGIGANTAIFSLTYQVLLSRLPVPHPEELVILRSPGPSNGHTWSDSSEPGLSFSYPAYKQLRDNNPVLAGVLARFPVSLSSSAGQAPQLTSGELVSGNYFEVLGVRPALGRLFSMEDETAVGANPVAVLSYGYWSRQYARDPTVLNQQVKINNVVLTVVGVAQQGFTGIQVGSMPDIFIPVTMKPQMTPNWDGMDDHRDRWLALMGRLKPGFTAQHAQAALQPFYHQILESELPVMKFPHNEESTFLSRQLYLDSGSHGRQIIQEGTEAPLLFLAAMVGLILMIACANLASLLIVKGEARQREIAVRVSLGAGRWRIVRQLLTETLLLAIAGGALGLALADLVLSAMAKPIQDNIGTLDFSARLDVHVLLFAAGATLVTAALFGIAPAMRMAHLDPQSQLKEQSGGASQGTANLRLRKALLIFQVGMTVLLVMEAALFTRSLLNLRNVDLGVKTDHVLQFTIAPQLNGYSPQRTQLFADQLRQRLSSMPGVGSVAACERVLFNDDEARGNVTIEGYTPQPTDEMHMYRNEVSPGFFSAMGIPLLEGRELRESDQLASPKVAVINETVMQKFFKGRDPVGRHFTFGGGNVRLDIEIVGVVKDSKFKDAQSAVVPFAYLPYAQDDKLGNLTFYVRTTQAPQAMVASFRRVVSEMDSSLPLDGVKTLDQQVDQSMFGERALAFLSIGLGTLAAIIAGIGLYGVMAYVVARRTREIGIRIALGATRRDISWLVLREVIWISSIGLAAGLVLAVAVGKAVEALLFGVAPSSPVIIVVTSVIIFGCALLAGGLPARRASRIEPVAALRFE